MKKVLVILGHPSNDSLCHALAESYTKGAKKAGAQVKKIYLSEIKFDPILHEGYNKRTDLEKDLLKARELLVWAEHIVLVHPIWWGSTPAILKGFFDRVLLPGFAFKYKNKTDLVPEKLLSGKTAHLIQTSGGYNWVYFFTGNPTLQSLDMFTFNFCGIKIKKKTLFGGVGKVSQKKLDKYIKKAEEFGKNIK